MTAETGGTYTLLVELTEQREIAVGALGTFRFDRGWYAYVGSALGTGGFARVNRHRELAAGERDTRHWHIDYLLGHPESHLRSVVETAGVEAECAVAATLEAHSATVADGRSLPEFGCSDCGCASHLFYGPEQSTLVEAVERAHETQQGETTVEQR